MEVIEGVVIVLGVFDVEGMLEGMLGVHLVVVMVEVKSLLALVLEVNEVNEEALSILLNHLVMVGVIGRDHHEVGHVEVVVPQVLSHL